MSESPPEHWSLLVGTSNWFRLWYPPQWLSEERNGTFAIRPPDGNAMLAISTVWLKDDLPDALPKLDDIVQQFPKIRYTQEISAEDQNFDECLKGEAILEAEPKWWQKMLGANSWRAWTMWAYHRERLRVVVTLLHAGERDLELESIVRMILQYMELPDAPADPPEVFAARVLKLAREKFPLLESSLSDDFQLQLGGSKINLGNFYRSHIRRPEAFEQQVLPALTTAVQVQGWGEEETMPPLEVVRDRLMPMLCADDVWQSKFPNVIGQPWVAGLVILYVVDESSAYWYVRDELLTRWELSIDDLHEIAVDNLQSYFERSPMEMAVATTSEGDPSMMMPGNADSYNSVRLLSHSFLKKMREVVQGDLAVGIPGRDFFVAVSTKLPDVVSQVRSKIAEDYRQTDHPLTDRMLLITADGVSELIDEV